MCPPVDPCPSLSRTTRRRHRPWSLSGSMRTSALTPLSRSMTTAANSLPAPSGPRPRIISPWCAGPGSSDPPGAGPWRTADTCHGAWNKTCSRPVIRSCACRRSSWPMSVTPPAPTASRTRSTPWPWPGQRYGNRPCPPPALTGPTETSACWSTIEKTWSTNGPGSSADCAGTCTNSTPAGTHRPQPRPSQRLRHPHHPPRRPRQHHGRHRRPPRPPPRRTPA